MSRSPPGSHFLDTDISPSVSQSMDNGVTGSNLTLMRVTRISAPWKKVYTARLLSSIRSVLCPVAASWPGSLLCALTFFLRARATGSFGHSIIYQLMYDPFVPGPFTVIERSMQAFDAARNRSFPCDVWRPTEPVGICPGGAGEHWQSFAVAQKWRLSNFSRLERRATGRGLARQHHAQHH